MTKYVLEKESVKINDTQNQYRKLLLFALIGLFLVGSAFALPSVDGVSISPAVPTPSDTLTCSAAGNGTSYQGFWTSNGVSGLNNSQIGEILTSNAGTVSTLEGYCVRTQTPVTGLLVNYTLQSRVTSCSPNQNSFCGGNYSLWIGNNTTPQTKLYESGFYEFHLLTSKYINDTANVSYSMSGSYLYGCFIETEGITTTNYGNNGQSSYSYFFSSDNGSTWTYVPSRPTWFVKTLNYSVISDPINASKTSLAVGNTYSCSVRGVDSSGYSGFLTSGTATISTVVQGACNKVEQGFSSFAGFAGIIIFVIFGMVAIFMVMHMRGLVSFDLEFGSGTIMSIAIGLLLIVLVFVVTLALGSGVISGASGGC